MSDNKSLKIFGHRGLVCGSNYVFFTHLDDPNNLSIVIYRNNQLFATSQRNLFKGCGAEVSRIQDFIRELKDKRGKELKKQYNKPLRSAQAKKDFFRYCLEDQTYKELNGLYYVPLLVHVLENYVEFSDPLGNKSKRDIF